MPKIDKIIISALNKTLKNIYPCAGSISLYLEIPKEKQFGDLSSNIAMRLTRELKTAPWQIAENILTELKKNRWFRWHC